MIQKTKDRTNRIPRHCDQHIKRRTFLGAVASSVSILLPQSSFADTQVSGPASSQLKPIDLALTEFLYVHKIPGASIAISRRGKLLYAKGYGVQDRNASEKVLHNSLFRIASVSKPITGVAIMQLVESKALRLKDKVVSVLSLRQAKDARWQDITIEHLLHHCAGFDKARSFDPMFHFREVSKERDTPFPIPHSLLIDYMLDQPLDHDPGSTYAYSNFGYCLLGRVIEKISGSSYDQFVQNKIWKPIGVKSAKIGKSLRQDRFPREVVYHDPSDRNGSPVLKTKDTLVPYPYGVWDVEAMDSHGGWVASAPQLVRFASDFDEPTQSKLLGPKSIESMFSIPSYLASDPVSPVGYGFGWQVRRLTGDSINAWHTGRLDGTAALLVRRHDGFNWAALFNSHLTRDGRYVIDVFDPLMHQAVDSVKQWPTKNLFPESLD